MFWYWNWTKVHIRLTAHIMIFDVFVHSHLMTREREML